MTFENAELDILMVGDRGMVSDRRVADEPELRRFIERFPDCFEHDDALCLWFFFPEGKPR
jgi:hypothetical protein